VKVRKLGATLGVELYQRDGRHLSLTDAGERLAAFALDSRRRVDDFLHELHAAGTPITLAAGRGTFRWVVPDAIRRITATGRRVGVIVADREASLAALTQGRADLAVVAFDPPPVQFASVQIAAYPQVLVADAAHPLGARRRVRLANLDGLDLVLPPPDRPHRRALERAAVDAEVAWRLAAEVDGWDLLVHFAALGVGATVVNGCVAVPAGLVAIPITDLPKVRYWAAWRTQRQTAVADLLTQLRRG
jgi:DNA-binding transcriptional LysR family regulator